MDLEIIELKKSFYRHLVLDSINLEIKSGKTIGLIGSNGSGKTTLFKCISGISSIDSGVIKIGSEVVSSLNQNSRKNIYYIGHGNGMYSHFTAYENLKFLADIYKIKSNVDLIIEEIGLGHLANKMIGFYSQGMLQKLKLASCVLISSEIILLDEPLAGLDQDGKNYFFNLLKVWQNEKKTIMISSHDINFLEEHANYTLKIDNGIINRLD
tara:strand:- start:1972 stop:2604 length:633 start_codon:yes stop_codon:yes gene_type:complete